MRSGTLGIIVTYLCNIRCRHCCFGCGPLKEEADAFLASVGDPRNGGDDGYALSPEEVESYIEEAARWSPFREAVFSGGEPTLFPKTLQAGIRAATLQGMRTRIVTNATWAKSAGAGIRLLAALCEEGLQEITISFTDFHNEFVSFDTVFSACRISRVLGLRMAISITTNDDSRVTAATVRQELASRGEDPGPITFFENDAIDTGRGKNLALPSSAASRGLSEGGCHAAGTQPVITPDRKVFACCGPPHRELELLKMGDLKRDSLTEILDRMRCNPLIRALHDDGPRSLLAQVDPNAVGGRQHICQYCKVLLTDHRESVLAYLEEHAHAG